MEGVALLYPQTFIRAACFVFISSILILVETHRVFAAQVTIGWIPSQESDLAGYRLYYGIDSRAYPYTVDTGTNPSGTVSGLVEGETYYFAATVYDNSNNESIFSEELIYKVPVDGSASPDLEDRLFVEDAEDGTTDGWTFYDRRSAGAQITNIFDDDRQSQVIWVRGSGVQDGFQLQNADGSKWRITNKFMMQWDMKCSERVIIYVDVETDQGHRYLTYDTVDHSNLGTGRYVFHGLGTDIMDGQWYTIVRDLQEDLEEAQPGVKILEVNGIKVRGNVRFDDIQFADNFPVTVYEDAEDGTTDRWRIYDSNPAGAQITNIIDDDRQSRVIWVRGTGRENGFQLRNADGSNWRNTDQFRIQWEMSCSEPVSIFVDVETDQGHRYLYYSADDTDYLALGTYIHHGLGTHIKDGQWRTITRDMQADLEEAQPGVAILEVNGLLTRGNVKFDNLMLMSTP